jgi:hypothetical protein
VIEVVLGVDVVIRVVVDWFVVVLIFVEVIVVGSGVDVLVVRVELVVVLVV